MRAPTQCVLCCVPAAVLEAATAGCELEDCEEKAVVLFYVEEALTNVTNAYLAFSTVSDTVLYSEEDFEERAAVFAETLQDVANLNANLTDYFVSCLLQLHAWLPGVGLLQKTKGSRPSTDWLELQCCMHCCAAHHQRFC